MSTPMTAFAPTKVTTGLERALITQDALRDTDSIAASPGVLGAPTGRLREAIVAIRDDFVSQEFLTRITIDIEKPASMARAVGG
jgi:hypothetical protein